MSEIKLYKSINKGLLLTAVGLGFVLIGVWALSNETASKVDYIMAWICICFFGLCLAVGLFNIFDRRVQILITEYGVWDRSNNEDEIKWEQITDVYPIDINGQTFISLVVENSYIFKHKQYKWAAKINEEIGAQQLNLNLGQIRVNTDQFMAVVYQLINIPLKDRKIIIQSFILNPTDFSCKQVEILDAIEQQTVAQENIKRVEQLNRRFILVAIIIFIIYLGNFLFTASGEDILKTNRFFVIPIWFWFFYDYKILQINKLYFASMGIALTILLYSQILNAIFPPTEEVNRATMLMPVIPLYFLFVQRLLRFIFKAIVKREPIVERYPDHFADLVYMLILFILPFGLLFIN